MTGIKYYLKLRANIILEGDVELAEREVRTFFGCVERVIKPSLVKKEIGLPLAVITSHVRPGACTGFVVSGCSKPSEQLVMLLTFIQEIWSENIFDENFIAEKCWISKVQYKGKEFACMVPSMACGELLGQTKKSSSQSTEIALLAKYLAGNDVSVRTLIKAPTSGGTSTQHVHSLHKYKAKFFPRLIRSFLIEHMDALPQNHQNRLTLLDPFVGSGTALIEASLLGIDSVGIDIDKLSCAISEAKIDALTVNSEEIRKAESILALATDLRSVKKETGYHFPSKIAKKFERWGSLQEQSEYENCITKWKTAIDGLTDERVRKLFSICLSDALTRKFVIRMLGTGVGRFALEIAKTSIDSLMLSNFRTLINSTSVVKSLIDAYNIELGKAEVHHGTAVKIPFDDNYFSIIVTSPPYLPASSGREDYLVGKSISNTALGLMTDEEMDKAESESVGSMKWGMENGDGLPKAVYELYDWLLNDPLREIKAKPTLAYYVSLKKALEENLRVLMPGGLAIYVIGKESVFYRFSTREVLYRVDCDKIFADIAKSCGFIIKDQINIELDKKNKNARPRSLDSYYESVFILQKN